MNRHNVKKIRSYICYIDLFLVLTPLMLCGCSKKITEINNTSEVSEAEIISEVEITSEAVLTDNEAGIIAETEIAQASEEIIVQTYNEEVTNEPTEENNPKEAQPYEEFDLSYLFANGIPKPENNFYILEDSDNRLITTEEIQDFNADKLEIAKGEIYARKGYITDNKTVQAYFGCQQWYKWYTPVTDDLDGLELNEYEKNNIRVLEERQKQSDESGPSDESSNLNEFRELISESDYRVVLQDAAGDVIPEESYSVILREDINEGTLFLNEDGKQIEIRQGWPDRMEPYQLLGLDIYEFNTGKSHCLLVSGNQDDMDGNDIILYEINGNTLLEVNWKGGTLKSVVDDMYCVEYTYEFTNVSRYTWYRFDQGKVTICGESLIENTGELEAGNTILCATPGYQEKDGKIVKRELSTDDRFRLLAADFRGMYGEGQKTQYWKVLVNDLEIVYVPAFFIEHGYGTFCEDGIGLRNHYDYSEFHR